MKLKWILTWVTVASLFVASGISHATSQRDLTRDVAQAGNGLPRLIAESAERTGQLVEMDGPEGMIRALKVTDRAGSAVQIKFDAYSRISQIVSEGRTVTFMYSSATATRPAYAVRNDRLYRIGEFWDTNVARTYREVRRNKSEAPDSRKYYSPDGEWDPTLWPRDYFDSCAVVYCIADSGGSDWWASATDWATRFGAWLQIGGLIGGMYAIGLDALGGSALAASLAEALQVYGMLGVAAAAVFVAGVYVGTWVYDSYGNAFWLGY